MKQATGAKEARRMLSSTSKQCRGETAVPGGVAQNAIYLYCCGARQNPMQRRVRLNYMIATQPVHSKVRKE
jgi:hypothetical protein